jgi:hypothetical protein
MSPSVCPTPCYGADPTRRPTRGGTSLAYALRLPFSTTTAPRYFTYQQMNVPTTTFNTTVHYPKQPLHFPWTRHVILRPNPSWRSAVNFSTNYICCPGAFSPKRRHYSTQPSEASASMVLHDAFQSQQEAAHFIESSTSCLRTSSKPRIYVSPFGTYQAM